MHIKLSQLFHYHEKLPHHDVTLTPVLKPRLDITGLNFKHLRNLRSNAAVSKLISICIALVDVACFVNDLFVDCLFYFLFIRVNF